MKNREKSARVSAGAVVLRHHGFAWTIPGLLVLLAPLTWGATLVPAAFLAARLWRSRQWVEGTRVVMERGIFFRQRHSLALTDVEFVQVTPCLFGEAVDCGTLRIHGAGGVTLTLRQLAHPRAAQRALQRAVNAAPRFRETSVPVPTGRRALVA